MNSIINKNLIELDMDCISKEEGINRLAQLIDNEERLNSFGEYVEEVLKREQLSTTGIGFGVAIPHAKTNAVKLPTVAFGRIKKGVDWQALDDNLVHMIFLLAVPEEAASNAHLKILAALSRKLIHEDFRNQLLSLDSQEELVEFLETILNNTAS